MIGWPSISSSRVTNCPGLKKNMIGWSAIKQKVRTSQVSWITLTQRTRWRPLAQVWVLTGLRKVLDMFAPAPFLGMPLRLCTSAASGYGSDCGQAHGRSLTYSRHPHAYRDQPPTIGARASETDSAMSPMDKAKARLDPTLRPKQATALARHLQGRETKQSACIKRLCVNHPTEFSLCATALSHEDRTNGPH